MIWYFLATLLVRYSLISCDFNYLTYLAARLFPNSNIFRSAGAAIDFDLTSPEADNLNFEVYDYQL